MFLKKTKMARQVPGLREIYETVLKLVGKMIYQFNSRILRNCRAQQLGKLNLHSSGKTGLRTAKPFHPFHLVHSFHLVHPVHSFHPVHPVYPVNLVHPFHLVHSFHPVHSVHLVHPVHSFHLVNPVHPVTQST